MKSTLYRWKRIYRNRFETNRFEMCRTLQINIHIITKFIICTVHRYYNGHRTTLLTETVWTPNFVQILVSSISGNLIKYGYVTCGVFKISKVVQAMEEKLRKKFLVEANFDTVVGESVLNDILKVSVGGGEANGVGSV